MSCGKMVGTQDRLTVPLCSGAARSQVCFQTRDYWILVCSLAVCNLIYDSTLNPVLGENYEER